MAVILLGALLLTWLTQAQGEMQWVDGILVRREVQHDGFPFEIECPGSDVIKIVSAHYGTRNKPNGQQYGTLNQTYCDLPDAKEIVSSRCNNHTHCNFDITRKIFPDPCPGFSKYLDVTYKCAKFLFKCPGHLSGIGRPIAHNVHVLPGDGSWTRDPMMHPDRVYFTTSESVLQEYWNLPDFVNGNPKKTYEISPRMTPTSVVVYDGNLYYVKEQSRHIVRFSLITQTRTKEYSVPPGRKKDDNGMILLHADETGLWVTYDNNEGRMVISKLAQDNLTPKDSWVTNLRQDQTSYIFLVCGTMYSVSSATGLVDYSYDTEAHGNREKFHLAIRFHDERIQAFSRLRPRPSLTFFTYNASSSTYNPRDRKLYLWDRTKHQAITMKLRFDSAVEDQNARQSPQHGDFASTTLPSSARSKFTNPTPGSHIQTTNKCHSIERKGMMWPRTRVGEIAQQECLDGTGGIAMWRCVKLDTELQAEWAKEGPSMRNCIDWINEIAANYYRHKADLVFTMESLQQEALLRFREISRKQLNILIQLTKQMLQNAFPVNQTSASRIVRATVSTMSTLIDNEAAWDSIDGKTKAKLVNDIMVTTEAAATLFVDGPGNNKLRIENTRVSSKNILFQAQSWERTPWDANYQLKTTFPDKVFCEANYLRNCLSDIITLPDMTIAKGRSRTGLIYTIYRGIGSLLDGSNSEKQLDSNIATVTIKSTANPSSRSPPSVHTSLRHISRFPGIRQCAKWMYTETTKHWSWSSEGCIVLRSNTSHTTCKCRGYGKYALLWDSASSEPYSIVPKDVKANEEILEIITSAGSAVAIICFLACVTTLLILRDVTGDIHTIRKNISICTLVAEVTFLVGINQTSNRIGCAFVAGLLQYSLLAIFTWIILEAAQLYKMLMDMFDEESRWKVYYAAGYGIPIVVLAVSVGIGFKDYGTSNACFINPTSGVMLLPIISTLTAIVAAVGILCAVIYKICTASMTFTSCGLISEIRTSVKKSFAILFLQLMTWIVAISWINERSTLLAILFCLFNSVLGMGTFICYCVLSKQIRKHYKNLFDRIGCGRTNSKDSYLEKSTTFQRSYTPARYASSDTNNGITIGSFGRHQYGPCEVTYPKSVLSSPDTEVMTSTFDTRDHSTLGQRLARTNAQHMYTPYPTRPNNQDQQTTLLPPYCHGAMTNCNATVSNATPYKDRHRHRHSECFHQVRSLDNDNHHKKYRTGLPAAPRRHHQKSRTMGLQHPTNTNPYRAPKSHSRPIVGNTELHKFMHGNIGDHVTSPSRHEPNPHHRYNVTPTQDGATYARSTSHQLPPNSIIQRLRDEMMPPDDRVRFIPVRDHPAAQSPPEVIQMPALSSRLNSRRKSHIRNENNTSDDEGQGSSVEESEHHSNFNNHSDVIRPQATYEETPFSSHRTKFRRQQAVLTSDPDDAIVTDYSGDGNESPIARHYAQWSNQELLV